MSAVTPEPDRSPSAMPAPALVAMAAGQFALGAALGFEPYFALLAIAVLVVERLGLHVCRKGWQTSLALILLSIPPLTLLSLFEKPFKPAFLQSALMSHNATYAAGLFAAAAALWNALQPPTLSRRRNQITITAAMMFAAGNLRDEHTRSDLFVPTLIVWTIATVLSLRALVHVQYPAVVRPAGGRRARVWTGVMIAALLAIAVGSASESNAYLKRYGGALFRFFRAGTNTGISQTARIGSVRRIIQNRAVALWYVRGEAGEPLYLVGRRYPTYYRGGTWKTKPTVYRKLTLRERPAAAPRHKAGLRMLRDEIPSSVALFDFETTETGVGPELTPETGLRLDRVLLTRHPNTTLYIPPRTRAAAIGAAELFLTDSGTMVVGEGVNAREYWLLAGPTTTGQGYPAPLTADQRELYLGVPDDLRPIFQEQVIEATREPVPGTPTKAYPPGATLPDHEIAHRIEAWFHTNFRYALEFDGDPKAVDPVVDFLVNKKPAWCEFYASSMALMLRSRGIPARYCGGYVAHDYDIGSMTYTVRGADAHAFVEVWIEGKGWVIHDPTPPAGRAENQAHQRPGFWSRLYETLYKWVLELALRASTVSFRDWLAFLAERFLDLLLSFIATPLRALFTIAALVLLGRWVLKRLRRGPSDDDDPDQFSQDSYDSHEPRLIAWRRALEQRLAGLGIANIAALTPLELAERLESRVQAAEPDALPEPWSPEALAAAADKMRRFSALRYRGAPPTEAEWSELGEPE